LLYDGAVSLGAGSTDANIPLSRGIPAVTFGLIAGGGAHTRGEWVEADSLVRGLCIALDTLLHYFDRTPDAVIPT
jgi:acetylornithine deacetylase/succinyl-diaminopimelate desuccinylase-like protein